MNELDTARARHRLYGLLGRLLLDGPVDAAAETVAALPALADVWPSGDADARLAMHQRVFGLEIFPYESVFLGEEGTLGGDATNRAQRTLTAAGFRGRRTDTQPDHVGLLLGALSWLAAAEAEALEDGADPGPARAHQARVIGGHLGRWLPVLSLSVSDMDRWTRRLLELTVEAVAAHGHAEPFELPPRPAELLDDPRTGLARIARAWLIPAHSGWVISRYTIGRLAARAGIPAGFGPRWKMLEGVLAGAVDHERASVVLDGLADELARWERGYAQAAELGYVVEPWRARLACTAGELERLREAASA